MALAQQHDGAFAPFLEYRSTQGARTPPVTERQQTGSPTLTVGDPAGFFSTILIRRSAGAAPLSGKPVSACAQQMLSTHLWALLTVVVAVSSFRFSTFLTRAIMSATAVPADPNLDSMAA